jgi:hypothetical protein
MHETREGWVPAVLDDRPQVVTEATMSARVFTEAQRSFAQKIDVATLQHHVDEVISLLWTESTTVTTFIPLLALRELRTRLGHDLDARQM